MQNDNKIKREQSKIVYNQSPILLAVTLLLIVPIISAYWENVEQKILFVVWAISVVALTLGRVWLILIFRAKSHIKSPGYWLNLFSFTSFISGTLWGVVLLYILNPSLHNDVLVFEFILAGMASGSMVTLSAYLLNYYAFLIPALLPFSLHQFNQQGSDFFITGSLVILYLLALMGFSVMANRNIRDTIRLRFENNELYEESKLQKELAEKASREKSQFLVATSHDLRQPLHALDLYLGALQEQLVEIKHIDLMSKATGASLSLSNLLNSLMDISRLDSGEVVVTTRTFSLATLLEEICMDFEAQAEGKRIVIEHSLDEAVVTTDPILLGRMLRNLISNAIKHNEDCLLSIITVVHDDHVIIEIKDTGKGIVTSELGNIFSEFYQLNNPERDREKGLGLGLAIVNRLSQLLNIPVEVSSEVAKGTQFLLSIPIEINGVIENERREVAADIMGLFIVVIDDDVRILDAIKSLLRTLGCEVLPISSQDEMIRILNKDSYPLPDLIISDYRLRDNEVGVDTVRAMRDYYKQEIPAIIITGDSSRSIVADITKEHCSLLLKPINSQRLQCEISKVLGLIEE